MDEPPEVPPVDGVEGAIDGVLLEMDGAEKLEPPEGEDGEILGAVGVYDGAGDEYLGCGDDAGGVYDGVDGLADGTVTGGV